MDFEVVKKNKAPETTNNIGRPKSSDLDMVAEAFRKMAVGEVLVIAVGNRSISSVQTNIRVALASRGIDVKQTLTCRKSKDRKSICLFKTK